MMKAPKEDVDKLFSKMYVVEDMMGDFPMCFETAKKCTIIAIRFASDILKSYGERSGELQNMEMEFRYLDSMEEQIKNL